MPFGTPRRTGGNWNFDGFGFYEHNCPTGSKVYDLTGNTITPKFVLNSDKNYFVTYWSKGQNCNISVTSPFVIGKTVNGWTFYKHRLSGIQSFTISGNTLIDELRLYPQEARMTTITNETLTGITSESGSEDETIKYEYDSFGRVIAIRNETNNILKIFCYNSFMQKAPCGSSGLSNSSVFTNSPIQTKVYKTCDLGYGSIGIPYTVSPKYTSLESLKDADAKGLKDILTFGQDYANKNGSCYRVYAKISYENVYNSGIFMYGDVVVRFYSNQQALTPIYVRNTNVDWSLKDFSGNKSNYSTNVTGEYQVLLSSTILKQILLNQQPPLILGKIFSLNNSLNYVIIP